MFDNMITRQPGRPCAFFLKREYAGQLKREEGKGWRRESDGLIVPKKAGNAAGGKETTHGRGV
jgi:hypothetical protein